MKPFIAVVLAIVASSGCIVRTRTAARSSEVRSCPPAHHWEDGECVHNGRPHVRDHR